MRSIGVKIFLVVGMLALMHSRSYGQTLETIRSLKESERQCLDKGQNMLRCTTIFYIEMDSVLNLAYSSLRNKLNAAEIAALKKNEQEWIKKKDAYFKNHVREVELQINAKKSEWGELGYQFLYADEADFIKERAVELITKLNGSQDNKG